VLCKSSGIPSSQRPVLATRPGISSSRVQASPCPGDASRRPVNPSSKSPEVDVPASSHPDIPTSQRPHVPATHPVPPLFQHAHVSSSRPDIPASPCPGDASRPPVIPACPRLVIPSRHPSVPMSRHSGVQAPWHPVIPTSRRPDIRSGMVCCRRIQLRIFLRTSWKF
jgi:hypothetical protein